MQIIDINDKLNIQGSIIMQIIYVSGIFFMVGALTMAAVSSSSKQKKIKVFNGLCCTIMLVFFAIFLLDDRYRQTTTQYEAIVTDHNVLEANGYIVIDHKKDDLYILEKVH